MCTPLQRALPLNSWPCHVSRNEPRNHRKVDMGLAICYLQQVKNSLCAILLVLRRFTSVAQSAQSLQQRGCSCTCKGGGIHLKCRLKPSGSSRTKLATHLQCPVFPEMPQVTSVTVGSPVSCEWRHMYGIKLKTV